VVKVLLDATTLTIDIWPNGTASMLLRNWWNIPPSARSYRLLSVINEVIDALTKIKFDEYGRIHPMIYNSGRTTRIHLNQSSFSLISLF
jgi:hypothetical protein